MAALLLGESRSSAERRPPAVRPTQWEFTTYDKSQAEALVSSFAAAGHELLFRVGDLVLLVPQGEAIARELENKHLDIRRGEVVLREAHDG